jgi:dihydrofolate reductase
MKSRTAFRLLLLLLLALPGRLAAQSQSAGGSIEGTVTDPSGAVLPGTTVTVKNEATGVVRETTSDGSGVFRAPLLPVGHYEVTAVLAGFATTKRTNQALTIGQTLVVDMSLKVASAQEEVTVTAEAERTVAELRTRPGKDIAVFGGGELFRSLLTAGLVDGVEVALIPVLLGGGIPFLPPPAGRAVLKLTSQRVYAKTGIVGLEYEIERRRQRARSERGRPAVDRSTARRSRSHP